MKPLGIGVATGEAAQNRITFKQLLQAEATDVAQIDAVRLGSVNECLVSLFQIFLSQDELLPTQIRTRP